MNQVYLYSKIVYEESSLLVQAFPIRSKFHWTVGPVNLKLLPDQNKFHQTVGGQWPILNLWDRNNNQKTKLTNKITGL